MKRRKNVVRIVLSIWLAIIIAMLYGPFIGMFVLSFTGPKGGPSFPMQGVSLHWYRDLLFPTEQMGVAGASVLKDFPNALGRSLVLAALTMFISTVLGTMMAMGFRRQFRASGVVFNLFLLGIIMPGIITGLGLALFYKSMDVTLNWYSTTLSAHILWTLPFTFIIMLTMFNRFDPRLEEAAMNLGANRWKTLSTVTLPVLTPGLLASFLFGFTLSFDEFARSSLVTGSQSTLPILVLGATTYRVTPSMYVIGTLTTVISFCIILTYASLVRRR